MGGPPGHLKTTVEYYSEDAITAVHKVFADEIRSDHRLQTVVGQSV